MNLELSQISNQATLLLTPHLLAMLSTIPKTIMSEIRRTRIKNRPKIMTIMINLYIIIIIVVLRNRSGSKCSKRNMKRKDEDLGQ
ncbi:hypothetical protein EDD11_002266 [Mortierella claussenii]|nr:hypothetical protein EDD11_002266 [Mortierella claussenii]